MVLISRAEDGATSSRSFIPTIKDNDLEVVTRRTSLRLGSIPDPAQLLDAPTASLDDLKRRIYGKPPTANSSRSPKALTPLNHPRCRTPPETVEGNVSICPIIFLNGKYFVAVCKLYFFASLHVK